MRPARRHASASRPCAVPATGAVKAGECLERAYRQHSGVVGSPNQTAAQPAAAAPATTAGQPGGRRRWMDGRWSLRSSIHRSGYDHSRVVEYSDLHRHELVSMPWEQKLWCAPLSHSSLVLRSACQRAKTVALLLDVGFISDLLREFFGGGTGPLGTVLLSQWVTCAGVAKGRSKSRGARSMAISLAAHGFATTELGATTHGGATAHDCDTSPGLHTPTSRERALTATRRASGVRHSNHL